MHDDQRRLPVQPPAPKKGSPQSMESITVPADDARLGPLAEVRQVSVGADDDLDAVNQLLADGWRLFHIGHAGDRTVYVLGKAPSPTKRPTGFLT